MTKDQFNNLKKSNNNVQIYCNCCENTYNINCFSYSHVHLDATASRCNICDWCKRRGNVTIEGWDNFEIRELVEFILFEKSNILNDIIDYIPNKTLEEVIQAYQKLKIGNKTVQIKTTCKCCGNETLKAPNVYLNNKDFYCSSKCYWEDKSNTVGKGEESIYYNKIKTRCTNCNKEINVIPFNYNQTNIYGDNHNFCSHECYWEYRSKYYVGEKSIGANRIISDEEKEKMKNRLIQNSRSAKRFDSKIQLTINDILNELNIDYQREYLIKYYALDNYLTESGLMIEVMGDYWHVNPFKYNEHSYLISEKQASWIHRDKIKHSYIINHTGVEILYLWEKDIEKNLETCKKLILEYIKSNGILNNYHSFNYTLSSNNKLELSSDLIIPYQSVDVEKYRHLISYKNIG